MNEQMPNKKIRVLQFICPTGFYGAERWILALVKHINPAIIDSELAVTAEANNTNLELSKHFKQLGFEVNDIPMKNKFDLSAITKLAELIKQNNIDIIHTHGYKSDIIGVLAAKKAGIHCVVTPHGFENAKDFKLRTFIWLGCQAMRFATKVVPLSQQLMQDCKRLGVRKDKLLYIQNGVDLSEVENAKAEVSASTLEKRIGFVGQMISRKNIVDLLDIFDALHQKHSNTRLILLGDGEQRTELERYTKTLKSQNHIEFLGFRDNRLELLKSFDLFVMTSTLEGIPRCLMEACAAEIPVAAYNIAGVDQLITHNQSGLLATLGDKNQLLEYWETLLFDKILAAKLASEAKRYVYDKYSAQRMAQEYSLLFKQLAKETT